MQLLGHWPTAPDGSNSEGESDPGEKWKAAFESLVSAAREIGPDEEEVSVSLYLLYSYLDI
jgi:hypothetical protein